MLISRALSITFNNSSDPEPYNQFQVKYVGNCAVSNPTGIETIRDAIGRLLTIHLESEWTPANALISATTVFFLMILLPPIENLSSCF